MDNLNHKNNYKHNFKIISLTIVFLSLIIFVLLTAFGIKQVLDKWQVLSFAYTHSNLVEAMQDQYKNEVVNVEQKFIVKEQSADDKLKEALVNELQPKK